LPQGLDTSSGRSREALLSVQDLSKSYQSSRVKWGSQRAGSQHNVLKDVSFTVASGEVVTLLGPSGCGKTTLLRIIAGLASADTGTILFNGENRPGPSKEKAFVFQQFGLLPWRNVLKNVEFPLELDGVPSAERTEIARKYIRLVNLTGFEKHYPHSLSGGMQQRVGIARALTRNPPLLLMDEPFGALDAQTRELLQEELLKILRETQNAVIFVTHSIAEAILLSNKIVVLAANPGRIKRIVKVERTVSSDVGLQRKSSDAQQEMEIELRNLLRSGNRVGDTPS
jgi:NitT/TauT family transport system ATP-binding protein